MTRCTPFFALLSFVIVTLTFHPAAAQSNSRQQAEIANYGESMAKYCINERWTTSWCRGVMGPSNKVLAANYIAQLKEEGAKGAQVAEKVKENCAAASVVEQQEVPRSVLVEVYTVCMNSMADAAAFSGIRPNPDHYRLLLIAYYCTNQNEEFCTQAESQLATLE